LSESERIGGIGITRVDSTKTKPPADRWLAQTRARWLTRARVISSSISPLINGTWASRRAIFAMVPRDMRTADPTRGQDFIDGYIALAGSSKDVGSGGLFEEPTPSKRFARALHNFSWMHHLRAHNSPDAAQLALGFVLDWISKRDEHPPLAFTPQVRARRALCLTNHAAFLLDNAEPSDYRLIMATILEDTRKAFSRRDLVRDPAERCRVVLACTSIAHALADHLPLRRLTMAALEATLRETFHLDGGTVTRRISDLPVLLADMIAFKALLEARTLPVPPRLIQTIASATRMLRMLRHPDGSLARFQGGMSVTNMAPDLVATVLSHDIERGPLPVLARQSGYARLEASRSLVLVECGEVPPPAAASDAHASCLAFEWSHDHRKIITNSPQLPLASHQGHETGIEQRRTAAHSTLSIDGASSALFAEDAEAAPLVSNGLNVVYDRDENASTRALVARHTGYRKRFGVDHERMLSLSQNGLMLEGRDRLRLSSGALARTARAPYTLHFHVQQGAAIHREGDRRLSIYLNGRTISFEVDGGELTVEDRLDRPGYRGPARSKQITVSSTAAQHAEINWRFIVQPPEEADPERENEANASQDEDTVQSTDETSSPK
jgi:uncharacterized heparinase superfamily protein